MKSLFHKAAIAAALCLTLGTQLSAHASTANLGTLSGTTPFSTATTTGSFENLYNFAVTPNHGAVLASTSVTFSSYGAVVSSVSIYLGSFATVGALAGHTPISLVSTSVGQNLGGGLSSHTVSAATYALTPGNAYTLVINGTSKGSSAYGTVIALSPVPEPESYAMLLAGLGMMGFIARRRAAKRG